MASNETQFGHDQLLGNAELPLLSTPTLRGNLRRHDPDNDHNYPYVPGLSTLALTLEISRVPLDTPVQETFTFTLAAHPDSLTDAIALINGQSSNVHASEAFGGFLQLESSHGGYTNYLRVVSGAAAALLGLAVHPYPGSTSYAGELESTPPTIGQGNPQGTRLVGKDEDLDSSVINRAIVGSQKATYQLLCSLDRELVGIKEYSDVAVIDGSSTPGVGSYFIIDDPTARIPLKEFMGGSLMDLVNLLGPNGEEVVPIAAAGGLGADVWDGTKVYVTDVCYGGPGWTGNVFSSWNPPSGGDGGRIFDTDVYQKTKHAAIAITSIHGDVVVCAGATFLTKLVQPGDTVVVQNSTNFHPFDHNGEYVVARVIAEDTLELRPKSAFEDKVFSGLATPSSLNNSGSLGEVLIPIGFFLPASRLRFRINLADAFGTGFKVRLMVGKKLREIAAAAQARPLANSANPIGRMFRSHVDELEVGNPTGLSFLHNASAIKLGALPDWYAGGEDQHQPAARVQSRMEQIIRDLASSADLTYGSGADRIGLRALTSSPRSIPATNVIGGIWSLLQYYNNHVYIGTADRHRAVDIDRGTDGPNWYDGTNNPGNAATVLSALDKIISDLANSTGAGSDGAAKIGLYQIAGTKVVSSGSVRSGLSDLLTHINNHLSAVAGYKHSANDIDSAAAVQSPHAFAAASVQTQLVNLLTWINGHFSGTTDKHAASAITALARTFIGGSSVEAQLASIDVNGAFLNRNNAFTGANSYSAQQTFNDTINLNLNAIIRANPSSDVNGVIALERTPTNRQLIWRAVSGSGAYTRAYSSNNLLGVTGAVGLEITTNAAWTGSQWQRDVAGNSVMYVLTTNEFSAYRHTNGTNPWADGTGTTSWDQIQFHFDFGDFNSIFAGGLTALGTLLSYNQPRLGTKRTSWSSGSGGYTLLWEMGNPENTECVRFYQSASDDHGVKYDQFSVVINGRWNGSNWVADKAGTAVRLGLSSLWGFYYQVKTGLSIGTTWSDTAWTSESFNFQANGSGWASLGYAQLSTSPYFSEGWTNYLTAKNLIKAWARVRINCRNAGGGLAVCTIQDGFNVNYVTTGDNTWFEVVTNFGTTPAYTGMNVFATMNRQDIASGEVLATSNYGCPTVIHWSTSAQIAFMQWSGYTGRVQTFPVTDVGQIFFFDVMFLGTT